MAVTAPRTTRPAVGLGTLLLGCAVLAAATLPWLREPTYDPAAWLAWGRQLAEGTLSTTNGPSWKPMPVLLTTPFSLLGDAAAQTLWMWTARFGGLAALAVAFVLTRRLGGRAAGLWAAGALLLATGFLYNAFRGDSEGLLVAFVLGGVLAFLAGRPHVALGLGLLAAMIRPEAAPLLVALGVWMLLRRPHRVRTLVLLGVAAAGLVAAWYVPEQLGSGSGLRAATRAQHPVAGSPGQSAFPFGMAFVAAFPFFCWPVYAGAIARVRDAWRARERTPADVAVLCLAAGSAVAMLEVAIGAEFGFTGRLRYATLPMAGIAVLGGLGLPGVIRQARASRGRVLLAVLAGVAVVVSAVAFVHNAGRLVRNERVYGRELPALIERAGGAAAVRACGPFASSPYESQVVGWRLGIDPSVIATRSVATAGTLLVLGDTASRLPLRARVGDWQLRSACG